MFNPLRSRLLSLVALVLISACSGGGSDEANIDANEPGQGSISVFLTDAETDRFNEILVTIDSITLLSADDGQQVITEEPFTINLRELTDFSEFIANANVAAGTYSKIRLTVSKIVVSEIDDNGNTVEAQDVALPSGKIDLNPQGQILIAEDDTETLEIDFDARKSFHLSETGNGKVQFRPVVFVRIVGRGEPEPGRIVREFGTVTAIDYENNTFRLCHAMRAQIAGSDGCLIVDYADDTRIFDKELLPQDETDLIENSDVTVFGHLLGMREGAHLDALALANGPRDNLMTLRSSVTTSGADSISVDVASAETDLSGTVNVEFADNVVVVSRMTGELLTTESLTVGTRLGLIGTYDEETEVFTAILVSVNDETET